jgi:iron complex transport system ATP-binding protein
MPAAALDHMISLEQISIGYKRNQPLLSGVNLTAEPGEMIALVGRNGTGKSTLLRSILGLTPLLAGKCLLRGIPLQDYDMRNRARTVSYVSSQVARIPAITVRELVSLGRIPYTGWMGRQGNEDRKLIEQAVIEVGMEKYMDRNLEQLSDGERQRVMIARAFVQDTPVMVLDEPAAYLDIPNKYELVRILSAFRDQQKTILYSTHDLETAMMCADKFWVILDGQIHEGSPEDLGLSGLFEQLFESSGIAFDRESGRFKYQLAPRGGIRLVDGPDQAVVWTRHTLERLGFEVSDSQEQTTVMVTRAGSGFHWIVKQGNAEKSLDSLYRLARFLTQDD